MTDLILRGSVAFPINGSLGISRELILRTWRWHQPAGFGSQPSTVIGDGYTGTLSYDQVGTVAFTRGSLSIVIDYGRELAFSSSETRFTSGSLQIEQIEVPVAGTLTAFGVWPAAAHDPEELYVESTTQNNSLGGTAQVWTRHNAVVGVGRGFNRFPRVTYLGVGYKMSAVPSNTNHYLKMVQLQKAALNGDTYPTTYKAAREVNTVVHPDRLNYSENPAFLVDRSHWGANNHGGDLVRMADGAGWCGHVTIPANNAVLTSHTVESLVIGRRYTASLAIYAPGYPNVSFTISGGTLLDSRDYATTKQIRRNKGVVRTFPYRIIWVVFDADSTVVDIELNVETIGSSGSLYITETMVERGQPLGANKVPGDYFDGASGADYLWEVGDTPGTARSYYYKNRAERRAAIVRLLKANVPIGIGIADPKFAVLPVSDDTLGMFEPYGSGFYGFGTYGG